MIFCHGDRHTVCSEMTSLFMKTKAARMCVTNVEAWLPEVARGDDLLSNPCRWFVCSEHREASCHLSESFSCRPFLFFYVFV